MLWLLLVRLNPLRRLGARWLSGACALLLACAFSLGVAAQSPGTATSTNISAQSRAQAEARLARGAFYYHYYNKEIDQAWAPLMRWQASGDPESKLMRAALLLQYGLIEQAQQWYEQHDQGLAGAPARALLHLSQRWYKHGVWPLAERTARLAIQHPKPLPEALLNQAQFVWLSSISEQQRAEQALAKLPIMREGTLWKGLARYNILLNLIRQDGSSIDLALLTREAVFYVPDSEEGRALHDRLLLLAGIRALDGGRYGQAQTYFSDMYTQGPYATAGLLQQGWAILRQANSRSQRQAAMRPWRFLQQYFAPTNPDVIESMLAMPQVLEQLGAYTQAMQRHGELQQHLSGMLAHNRELQSPKLIQAWLNDWVLKQRNQPWGWRRFDLSDLPNNEASRALQWLLDDNSFVLALEQLHDLDRIDLDLQQSLRQLDLWDDMITQQRRYLVAQRSKPRLTQLQTRVKRSLATLNTMIARLTRDQALAQQPPLDARGRVNPLALLTPVERDQVQRLARAKQAVTLLAKQVPPSRNYASYEQRWQRAQALWWWHYKNGLAAKLAKAKQAQTELEQQATQLQDTITNLADTVRFANRSWGQAQPKLPALRRRIEANRGHLKSLLSQQTNAVLVLTQTYLQQQEVRLTEYLANSRLASARLYDDALQRNIQNGNDAPAKVSAP